MWCGTSVASARNESELNEEVGVNGDEEEEREGRGWGEGGGVRTCLGGPLLPLFVDAVQ
jgi:hypothetical protein